MPLLLAAPDKFRGTASAAEVAEAVARAGSSRNWDVRPMPLADGGDGLLEVLGTRGGERRRVRVTGPLGDPVEAEWLRVGDHAIVEMAQASGLALVGGAAGNDPMAASTRGTGELIVAAARSLGEPVAAGGHSHPVGTVVVGLGGSATTDGGAGALAAVEEAGGLGGVALVGACDVNVDFLEAARQFARQKGADDAQVAELEARLRVIAERYSREYAVDVLHTQGTGAAGGLGGALVALGGELRSGYEVVTELLGFQQVLDQCDLVVTGEGALDVTSFAGKVVGSVLRDASTRGVPALVVAGRASPAGTARANALGARLVSLCDVYGEERSLQDTASCIEASVAEYLDSGSSSG